MSDMFQIRRWNANGDYTWELWVLVERAGWFRRARWEKLSSHKTEEAAGKAMRRYIAPHYDRTEYYDEHGCRDCSF